MSSIIWKRTMARSALKIFSQRVLVPKGKKLPKVSNLTRVESNESHRKQKVKENLPIIKENISSGEREIVIEGKRELEKQSIHGPNPTTFQELLLRTDVIQGLESLGIAQPTIIQSLAISKILEKKNLLCAAQTGSGKTCAYAAPIIHLIRQSEEDGHISRLNKPRALVIAPGRELASQILDVFKSLSHHAPFRSVGIIGQKKKKWIKSSLNDVVDVVVGTPVSVLQYHKRGLFLFSDLEFLVIDEADTLVDENFCEATMQVLNLCKIQERLADPYKSPVQCILATATLPPKGVISKYKKVITDLEICQSNLHKVLPFVKHTFVKCTQSDKSGKLLPLLEKVLSRNELDQRVMVFCNKSASCNWLSDLLTTNNIEHSKLHGNMKPQTRFADFTKFQKGERKILICTDLASRGLDTSSVHLVINFDCPFNATDYVHRAGRTGRARGSHSRLPEVITYITQNKEVSFANRIKNAAAKNSEIEDIRQKTNSAKLRYEKELEELKEKEHAFQ